MIAAPIEIEQLLRTELLADAELEGSSSVLHERSKSRGGVLRLPLEAGGAMVVKVWHLRTLKERVKSRLGLSNGAHEWRMHRFIHGGGLITPAPLGFLRLQLPGGGALEAMAIEDLGETTMVRRRLESLLLSGEEDAILNLESVVIESTRRLLSMGVIDIDHQLNNFLVDREGTIHRIDFECARRVRCPGTRRAARATMLARLISSHIYAAQPDVHRSERFAARLYEVIRPSRKDRERIQLEVAANLERQYQRKGVRASVVLPN